MEITRSQLVGAFTRWETEFRDHPETFLSRGDIDDGPPAAYGEGATRTLLEYIDEGVTSE